MDRQGAGAVGRLVRGRRGAPTPGFPRRVAAAGAGAASSIARVLSAVAALGWLAVLLLLAGLLTVALIDAAVRRSATEAIVATVMALSIGPVLVREWRRRGEVRSMVTARPVTAAVERDRPAPSGP